MPDLRLTPGSLNLTVFAGQGFTLNLEWPAGNLDGRTFTATIVTADEDITLTPPVTIDGDTLSVEVTGDDTTTMYGRSADWRLYDTAAPDVVVLGGRFKSTNQLGSPTERTVEVTDRVAEVPVRVVGAPGAAGADGPPGAAVVAVYAGTTYDEGELRYYDGKVYRAIEDLTGQDPDTLDPENWEQSSGDVASFNTRTGPISLLKSDVTDTGLAAPDVGAIGSSGGGREDSVVDLNVDGEYEIDLSRGNHFELHLDGDVTTLLMPDAAQTPNDGLYQCSFEVFYNGFTIDAFDERVRAPGGLPFAPDLNTNSDLFGAYMNRDNTLWTVLHVTQKSQFVASYIDLQLGGQPPAPASGILRVWGNATDQHLKSIDGTGAVTDYNTGGTGPPDPGDDPQISEVAGQVAFNQVSGTSVTASMPSDVTVDNLLVAVFWGGRYGTPTITPESGFTLAKRVDDDDATGFIAIYYKIATGPDDASFVFSYSGGSGDYGGGATTPTGLWVQEYTDNETSGVLDRHGSYDSPDGSTYQWDFDTDGPSGSGVTTLANELAVVGGLFGIAYGDTPTWGVTGFANVQVAQKAFVGVKLLTELDTVDVHVGSPVHNNFFAGVVATFKAAAP